MDKLDITLERLEKLRRIRAELEELGYPIPEKPQKVPAVKFTLEKGGCVFVSFNGGTPIEAGSNKSSAIKFAEKITGKKIRIR